MQIVYSCRYCTKKRLPWLNSVRLSYFGKFTPTTLFSTHTHTHIYIVIIWLLYNILLSLNTWIGIFFSASAGACVRQNGYNNDAISCENYTKENLQ